MTISSAMLNKKWMLNKTLIVCATAWNVKRLVALRVYRVKRVAA